MRGSVFLFWAVVVLSSVAACGGDDPADWPEGRPRIDDLQFLRQAPQNPRALEFSLEFFDSDADTGRGQLFLYLDGEETAVRPMTDIFPASKPPLALDASAGRFNVTIELAGTVEVGQQVELSFLLEDEKRRRSNEPSIVLEALPE